MKKAVLATTVIVLVAVIATLLDWRERQTHRRAPLPAKAPHITTAAEIQGGPLTPQRRRTFTGLACGQGVVTNDKGEIGCPVCPQGSDFAVPPTTQTNPSDPPPAQLPEEGWTYGGIIFGHFTAPGADEALLKTNGCESHANNLGGDVLLRKTGSAWSRVRYLHGGLADEGCQRVAWEGGRDALVCHTSDMHQGIATDTALLMTVEPGAAPEGQSGDSSWFLSVSDDEGDCESGAEPLKTTQSASIDRINLIPSSNGRKDVEILASIGRIKAPAVQDACPAAPRKPYRLLFHHEGDHFAVADGLPALQALGQEECCEVRAGTEVRPLRF